MDGWIRVVNGEWMEFRFVYRSVQISINFEDGSFSTGGTLLCTSLSFAFGAAMDGRKEPFDRRG